MKKKYDNGMLKTELSADGKIIHFSLKVTDLGGQNERLRDMYLSRLSETG